MPSRLFDLVQRARLSLNYFTRHVDPRTGYDYIWTYLLTDPPKAAHEPWDLVEEAGRALEALVLIRLMTGSEEGLARERWLVDNFAVMQSDDGLIYRPRTPWSKRLADLYDQASALTGIVLRFAVDGDGACGRIIERNLAALERYLAWDGRGYARVAFVGVEDGRALERYDGQILESDNPEELDEAWMGRFIGPLVTYAHATGKERPLEIARALSRDVAFRSGRYGKDGSFSRARHGEDSVWSNGHFHSRANTMAAVLRVARETGDKDLAQWAETVFRWALTQGTAFGWFPEFVGRRGDTEGCETCGVVDMLEAAILLAKSGRADGWDIADRIWRNQLLESQLRDASWVTCTRARGESETESFDRVAERALGGFAGWSAPNDLISDYPDRYFASLDPTQDHRRSLMACCCGSGPKGLYLAWHHAIETAAAGVAVNFAVSRRSDAATVRSLEPAEGAVEVTMHRDGALRFRVPGKTDAASAAVTVNGRAADASREGGFLALANLTKDDVVRFDYPLGERTETVTVGDPEFNRPAEYRVTWKGNTVVRVDPPGRHCPLYQREAAGAEAADPPAGPPPRSEFEW